MAFLLSTLWLLVTVQHASLVGAQGSAVITFNSEPGYAALRVCAQNCIGYHPGIENVNDFFDCPEPWPNSCYCAYGRTDLAASGESFLTSCVSTQCTQGDPSPDASSALAFYLSYCAQNGITLPANGQAVPASTTSVDSTAATVTNVVVTTVTSGSGSGAAPPSVTPYSQSEWICSFTIVVFAEIGVFGFGSLVRAHNGWPICHERGSPQIRADINTATSISKQVTVDITSTTTVSRQNAGSTSQSGGGSSLSMSDRIALGVGLGVGIPSAITGIWTFILAHHHFMISG